MATVAWFRKFEFLVVAGFLVLGTGYVLIARSMHRRVQAPAKLVQVVLDAAKPGPTEVPEAEKALPFAITDTNWSQVDGHWLLELRLRYRNDAAAEAVLEQPDVSLVNASGETVDSFFLATAVPPRVAPGAEETVDLRYWMGADRAKETLWLRVGPDRTRVESPGPPEA